MMTGQQYADGLQDFVHYMEEPMADPSSIPLYLFVALGQRFSHDHAVR